VLSDLPESFQHNISKDKHFYTVLVLLQGQVVLQRFYQAGQFPFGRDRFLSAGYATVHELHLQERTPHSVLYFQQQFPTMGP
jgi:hypothetical protein